MGKWEIVCLRDPFNQSRYILSLSRYFHVNDMISLKTIGKVIGGPAANSENGKSYKSMQLLQKVISTTKQC